MERVFVYGSLRRGQYNHHVLRGARLLGPHRSRPRYTMLDLGRYPGVVQGGSTAIVGEVYAVNRMILARLDALEGCPIDYQRGRLPTLYGPAWVYLLCRPPHHPRTTRPATGCADTAFDRVG